MLGDTILCLEKSNEQLTLSSSWPQLPVTVKGREVICPNILVRKTQAQESQATALQHLIQTPDHPVESNPIPVESVWEMELPASVPSIWDDEESHYPEGSVLE